MRKTNNYSVEVYKDGHFVIEIVDAIDRHGTKVMEAWLRHEDCGIADFMFGLLYEQAGKVFTRNELLEIVSCNLPEYEAEYEAEYMDESEE